MSQGPQEILFLGQVPPPVHGQAVINALILSRPLPGYILHHIPLDASHLAGETGKFKIGKVLRTLRTVFRVLRFHFGHPQVRTLYYPPGGSRLGLLRDSFLLFLLRRFFPNLILHHHARGVDRVLDTLPSWERRFILSSLSNPLLSIAVSPDGEEECQLFSPQTVRVVWNGVQDTPFPDHARDSGPINILFLGRLSEEKGIVVFLSALGKLKERGVSFRATIVGRADNEESLGRLISLARTLQIDSAISWKGELSGKAKDEQFALADIYCNPTHYPFEACPVTGIEGFKFGKACVFSAWRGLLPLAAENEFALLFPAKDSEALASTLEQLILDAPRREELGGKARARYLELFTEEQFRRNLQGAFDSVLSPG